MTRLLQKEAKINIHDPDYMNGLNTTCKRTNSTITLSEPYYHNKLSTHMLCFTDINKNGAKLQHYRK